MLASLAQNTGEIREYVTYRRAMLAKPRLGGNAGPGMIAAADEIAWLNNLIRFADWLDEGKPSAGSVLTDDQKTSYRAAKAAGATFPPEIEKQL